MSKGEQTKARMIDVTASLVRRQGYAGTGLNEIVRESGAPKGSLYFHFPGGKDELVAAAMVAAAAEWRGRLLSVLQACPADPAGDVRAICAALAAELEGSGFAHGCPLATVTLETAAQNEALRAVSAEHFRGWEALIAGRLVAGGVDPARAGPLATLVLSGVEGAMLLARAYRDVAPLERVAGQLAEALNAAVGRGREAAGPPAG